MDKDKKNKDKSWMDRNFVPLMAVLIVILFLSVGVAFWFDADIDKNKQLKDIDKANGWVLFTLTTCPACNAQKEIIADDIDLFLVIDCDGSQTNYDLCLEHNITVVPTWLNIYDGRKIEGYQTVEHIIDFTGGDNIE